VPDPIPFPGGEDADAIARRVKEAERLAAQSPAERAFRMQQSADRLGIPVAELRATVDAIVRERKEAADKQERQDREGDRKAARHEAEARDKAKAKQKLFRQLQGQSAAKQEAEIKFWCETYKEDPEVITKHQKIRDLRIGRIRHIAEPCAVSGSGHCRQIALGSMPRAIAAMTTGSTATLVRSRLATHE
jgi:hypothetical protein